MSRSFLESLLESVSRFGRFIHVRFRTACLVLSIMLMISDEEFRRDSADFIWGNRMLLRNNKQESGESLATFSIELIPTLLFVIPYPDLDL